MTQPLGGGGLRGSLAEPGSGLSHRALLSPAASLSTQGVDVEHTAALQGVRYAHSLQQGASDYYRALTPALEMLVRGTGEQGGGVRRRQDTWSSAGGPGQPRSVHWRVCGGGGPRASGLLQGLWATFRGQAVSSGGEMRPHIQGWRECEMGPPLWKSSS